MPATLGLSPRGTLTPTSGRSIFEPLERRQLLDALPHPDDPVLQQEHLAVMALVPDSAVTNTVIASGSWSDPSIWSDGVLPATGANVLVAPNVVATVDAVEPAILHTVRVDGTLKFAAAQNTQLTVDTMIVSPNGSLIMGDANEPIASGATARILFADTGPIDTTWDPNLFSRGLISHGTVSMFGQYKTPYAALAQPALKGGTKLLLNAVPTNWQVGDQLLLTGTYAAANQDERLTILAINGKEVTVRALTYAHAPPSNDLSVYVANLSRNVVLQSQSQTTLATPTARRAHTMFMHAPRVNINNAAFVGLGRTDKKIRINDPQLDTSGQLIPGTGTNARGRYAVHFHRTGINNTVAPVTVRGSVVLNSPGWGYVNHSSNALFEDNVAVDVAGAAFVTETGNEIGAFNRNLAIRSVGSGAGIESRRDIQDFGHQGDGFWFQGGGVDVAGNIATGQKHAGFVFFTEGLIQPNLGKTAFDADNLVNPAWANGEDHIAVGNVPIRSFVNNVAYASGTGLETWFHLRNVTHGGRSVIDGLKIWNNRSTRAVFIPYTHNTTLRNVQARRSLTAPAGVAVGRNDVTKNIIYENMDLRGWAVGISVPVHGHNAVLGGTLQNLRNIDIADNTALRTVTITGVTFLALPTSTTASLEPAPQQFDIFIATPVLLPADRDLAKVFADDTVVRDNDTVSLNGKQLYAPRQAADFVPWPATTSPSWVPAALLDQTNQQLWDNHGWAVGGVVAPSDAVAQPRTNALVGSPRPHLPPVTLNSRKYTRVLTNYRLIYTFNGVRVIDPTLVQLSEGWNVITRTIGGRPRSFLVFGDVTPPTFTLAPAQKLVINPLALGHGFTVRGTVTDNSTGTSNFSRMFNDLSTRPVQTRTDGSKFIRLTFRITDRASNFTDVSLELTLDPTAPL